jgi:PAS domain S-box-containing protein
MTRSRRATHAVPVLSRLAEIAPVGMLVTGLDGAVRYLNPAFTRLLGHRLETGQNLDGFGLVHPEDTGAARQHLVRLARGETDHYRGEHRFNHADGNPVWVMLAAALSRDEDE